MTDFQQQALQLASQQQNSPAWLRTLRSEGAGQWQRSGWPGRRTELWKYTPLQALQRTDFQGWGRALPQGAGSASLLTLDAIRLVLVNGVFDVQ